MGLSSDRRRRRRAVDGEQLLALSAAAVAEAGREACTKAGRAKEDGVGRAAVVVLDSTDALIDFHTGSNNASCKCICLQARVSPAKKPPPPSRQRSATR